ncbi:MAG: 4'-phosphopantetheinyl transferase family protein [Ruminococcus sp.]
MIFMVEKISDYSDETYREAFSALPRWRQEKATRYRLEADRRRSVFAYSLLEKTLSQFPKARDKKIYADEKGKLHLEQDSLFLSLSHSGDYVACAVSHHPVGIDIEEIHPINCAVIKRVCCSEEIFYVYKYESEDEIYKKILAGKISEEETKRFLHIWTAKEAFLKLTGEGLAGGIDKFSVADRKGLLNPLPTGEKLISSQEAEYVLSVVSRC